MAMGIRRPAAPGGRLRPQIETMPKRTHHASALVEKIHSLPPEKVAEVEDLVDFLAQRDERRLTSAAARLSEKAFRKAWDNPRHAAYDRL
jgi:hypothetical protein